MEREDVEREDVVREDVVRAMTREVPTERIRGWASTERLPAGPRAARTRELVADQRIFGGAIRNHPG